MKSFKQYIAEAYGDELAGGHNHPLDIFLQKFNDVLNLFNKARRDKNMLSMS